jgi:hypothetical protein
MSRASLVAAIALCACSEKPAPNDAGVADLAAPQQAADLSVTCAGVPPSIRLVEGYCQAGEADRCFYTQKPADGY